MMSCTKVARSTLLEPRFSPSNQIHSVHFENIGSRNRTAVTLCRRAQAARILKLELPMNYSDDSAAGVSDREPTAGGETERIACSSRMRQAYAATRLGREPAIFPSTLCIPRNGIAAR
jgi:hypothetical protein